MFNTCYKKYRLIPVVRYNLQTVYTRFSDFGSASRVSKVLDKKRQLTLDMLRKLPKGLGISAETLPAE